MKPGYKTTEFWLTLLNTVSMALVAFGLVSNEEAEGWKTVIAPVITAIIPLVLYIWSRTRVKQIS